MIASWREITPEHLERWKQRLAIHNAEGIPMERQQRMAWIWIKLSNDPTARELRGGVVTLAESDWLHQQVGM